MIDEILFGGTYSNQVSTLEAKIDALALGMHSIEDKLDMIKTAFDRSLDIELEEKQRKIAKLKKLKMSGLTPGEHLASQLV